MHGKYLVSYKILLFCSLLIHVILFQSCDKHRAKKIAGTYHCNVHYHYYDGIPQVIDSTYIENLTVTQDGKYINVLNYHIHIDSLWNEQEYYEGYIHNYITVKFIEDSIYVTRCSGGLGGSASYTYTGKK